MLFARKDKAAHHLDHSTVSPCIGEAWPYRFCCCAMVFMPTRRPVSAQKGKTRWAQGWPKQPSRSTANSMGTVSMPTDTFGNSDQSNLNQSCSTIRIAVLRMRIVQDALHGAGCGNTGGRW